MKNLTFRNIPSRLKKGCSALFILLISAALSFWGASGSDKDKSLDQYLAEYRVCVYASIFMINSDGFDINSAKAIAPLLCMLERNTVVDAWTQRHPDASSKRIREAVEKMMEYELRNRFD
jgi:hypothetical protein